MTEAPIKILLVEDDPGDAKLTQSAMRRHTKFAFSIAPTIAKAMEKLAEDNFDVALLDLSLPDAFGLEALARVRAFRPELPIVVLTGNDDDELALAALQQGAQDYLVKDYGDIGLIVRAIRYAIERSRADANLRRSEGQFRAIFENAGLGIALIDAQGQIFSQNPALRMMLGEDLSLVHAHLSSRLHPEDREILQHQWSELMERRLERFALEARLNAATGRTLWCQIVFTPVRSANAQLHYVVGLVEDISARRALEEQQALAANVLEATNEGIFITDANAAIVHVNPAFSQLTGYTADEVIGKRPSVLSSGRHDQTFYEALWKSLKEDGFWRGEIWNRRKSGEIYAEWLTISAVRNERGVPEHYVAVFSDITSRKKSEERLSHLANHDPLTGLPNRTLFTERLDRAILRGERNHLNLAVLFLDLDHFKQINDTLGHLAGDALLRQVAERLNSSVRREDTVARLGGDEFTLLLEDIDDFRDAATVARKVLKRFAAPFHLNGQPRKVSTSIGISLYPSDGRTVDALIKGADEAMYTAKKEGRGTFRFAREDLSQKAFERHTLERALGKALKRDEMKLFFQPVVAFGEKRVVGAESLLRWLHPDIGLMAPGQFLTIAVESGHMAGIGRWALRRSLQKLHDFDKVDPDFKMHVNFSDAELGLPDLIEALRQEIMAASVAPSRLNVDIPLSFAAKAGAEQALSQLAALGVGLALDDFGGGAAEMDILRQSGASQVKLNRAFVHGLGKTDEMDAHLEALISEIHQNGATVLAKGVETADQAEVLARAGCDTAQGFLFGRPVPAAEFLPSRHLPASSLG